jgi:C4-type Zn-finger protein
MPDNPDPQRECPLCGEMMRLKRHSRAQVVPGRTEQKQIEVVEWECPECDYFEEFSEEGSPR